MPHIRFVIKHAHRLELSFNIFTGATVLKRLSLINIFTGATVLKRLSLINIFTGATILEIVVLYGGRLKYLCTSVMPGVVFQIDYFRAHECMGLPGVSQLDPPLTQGQ